MKHNSYIILGIILITIGLMTQVQGIIKLDSGPDSTLPEYDINYLIPRNGTYYYWLPSIQLWVRDLESGIQSVEFQIWPFIGTQNDMRDCQLVRTVTYPSGWETWAYNFTSPPTNPGKYLFLFIVTNGAGMKSSNSYIGRWWFYIVDTGSINPPPSGTGSLQITINIDGQSMPNEQVFFEISGPNYNTTRYGNNFMILGMPPGTYRVKATYKGQIQIQQPQIFAGAATGITFDFQSSSNNNVSPPIEPTAYNEGELIPPTQILPLSGVVLIIGAIILVMGLRKKNKPG